MDDLISRKAALSILHNKAFDSVKNDEKYNLLRWCMKQIESLPTIQPQGIDKDRLIEFIDDIKDNTMYEDEFDEYSPYEIIAIMDELIDFINQQPTSDGWIPVSDKSKLEDGKEYLITDYMGDIDRARYCKEQDRWFSASPIAYMPLPQPYKESE